MQITPIKDEEDFELPSYKDKGDLLVEVIEKDESKIYKWVIGDYDYDSGTSIFWISEGVGIDYFVNELVDEIDSPGWYVIEGIHGAYFRGDGWSTDDDEEWYYDRVRPATLKETEVFIDNDSVN